MIVRDRPHGLALFFAMRGSVLPSILPALAVNVLFAGIVTVLHGEFLDHKIQVTTVPFSLIGLALAIFLGFRNSAAYDRYWEGRKLWGEMVHASRSWARGVMCYPTNHGEASAGPGRRSMVMTVAAMVHALRHQLRGTDARADLVRCLGDEAASQVVRRRNMPAALLQQAGQGLGAWLHSGQLDPQLAATMENRLAELTACAAGCERIASTPIPFAYTLLLHRTAYIYCFLLPFGLVDTLHGLTPLVVGLVAYTFFGLDALGDEIEDPFGTKLNHLPLDALCVTIETSLREALGEENLPAPPQAERYVLT
ncbi:bestrophin [Ideonella dechloratans]|uniref:Bestrophin n=1 Tax=Ideonella dechloratans TaxID=36863 RepID=A0A643FFJ6_IDEDE|nr:bestrophin family ion channel [Ideonella dechloratans]KAB0582513.1 bestrophin [Ideonella dechloratans]UFU11417.1 bestrophin [Ideonella dechloratans]